MRTIFGTTLASGLLMTLPLLAATTPSSPAKPTEPAKLVIQSSVFDLPTGPSEGKDPFFPRSMRPFSVPVVVPTNTPSPVVPTVELHLNGISGAAGRRLAIINNHTLAAGEDDEFTAGSLRVHIRCLEIREDTVVVLVGRERRILSLRPGL